MWSDRTYRLHPLPDRCRAAALCRRALRGRGQLGDLVARARRVRADHDDEADLSEAAKEAARVAAAEEDFEDGRTIEFMPEGCWRRWGPQDVKFAWALLYFAVPFAIVAVVLQALDPSTAHSFSSHNSSPALLLYNTYFLSSVLLLDGLSS